MLLRQRDEEAGMMMSPEDVWDELVAMFGDRLPDMDHEPIRFAYCVKLYLYQKGLNNG